jgi:ABC-type spermidine/putrescine transport system permease subunit I
VKRLPFVLAVAPSAALVATFVLAPLLVIVRTSLYRPASGSGFYVPDTTTLANYAAIADPYGVRLVAFTAAFGTVVALCAVVVAFPMALFLRMLSPRWQALALAVVLIPKTAGLLATMFGLQRLLPRGLVASVVGESYLVLPYAVLVICVHLRSLDPAWEAAARGLGAGRWATFRRVTFPLALPGILLALELGLMWGVGAFLGPLFLGGPDEMTLSVEVHRQAFDYGRWPRAAALAVVLLLLATAALLVLLALPARWRRSET